MPTQKDNHSVTGSPLMGLEFVIIHTIIWGFFLSILFYAIELFLTPLLFRSGMNALCRYVLLPLFSCLHIFLDWPNVMLTALVITIIRCIFRRTEVTLSDNTVIIRRPGHTDRLFLADFIRPKTVESYVNVHYAAWVFRKRYLIFQDDAGKEVKYRLYEYSEKDLEHVMQLLTRISRTESLNEDEKTNVIMDAFQNKREILFDPRRLWGRMAGYLTIFCVFCPAVFLVFLFVFYEMLFSPLQYHLGPTLSQIIGYGSILISLGSLLLLCRALWALAVNAILQKSCPQRIAFTGDMLQIDQTLYSVNRIQQIVMNPPNKKLPLFGHYQITVVTTDGTHKYWLGNNAGLAYGTWPTLCRDMQELLISYPAKLIYR